jgi:xanthine/CO dehydrogenase XdhC/CoxF family maturation factor
LPIGSKTPPEIAIAVLAEITAERKTKNSAPADLNKSTKNSSALA